ncbi:hypothetical protein HKD37_04G011592 [Glycine soja]
MDSKQCNPSNSGANLGLKRGGFCLDPAVDDGFGSFLAAEEEVASILGFELTPFTGPVPKENLQFWACAISKWLKIDIMASLWMSCLLLCSGCCVCNDTITKMSIYI